MDTNNRLTREEIASLAPYEFNLQASLADYLRAVEPAGNTLFHQIYERVTFTTFEDTDKCGNCQLRLTKFIAKWYFDSKAHYKEQDKAKAARSNKKK